MKQRPHMAVRVYEDTPEARKQLLRETILRWRALGPAAAWQAIYDMLGFWFEVRGLDPEAQRVDRSRVEVHPVPWLTTKADSTAEHVRPSRKRSGA